MSVQQESLDAYRRKQQDGTLQSDQMKVLDLIRELGGCTIFQASQRLRKPENRISGRFSELCKAGSITKSNIRRINPETGNACTVWISHSIGDE